MIVNSYLDVPSQRGAEFWDVNRISHIRRLATTGKGEVRVEKAGSLRILDRVYFKRLEKGREAEIVTKMLGTELRSPVYLGDMSFGALSGTPNVVIAEAADKTGTLAGTGEGGLHPEVAKHRNILVQWASARFGVDINTLMAGRGIVIKIGQGAKPGIGGHLPGSKVTDPISLTRRIPKGIDAISPAPHHDIYSIEDLGQRIEALKEATGKPVLVKVAATNYIPYVVSGIARMGADGVIIDGHGAGTGATPTAVRDNIGIPIELAVASADRVLRREGRREGFYVIAGGRVGDAMDAAKLIALGADAVNLGTSVLIAMGCVMVHKCHIGSCPTALTNKIDGTREIDFDFALSRLVNFVNGFSEELSEIVGGLGLRRVSDLVGRRDLLRGNSLTKDALGVLGIEGVPEDSEPSIRSKESNEVLTHLHELASKGVPTVTSMGSTAPPDVELPRRIVDWLRIDGAQVTRPSIDPYREEIDSSVRLLGGKLPFSAPLGFDVRHAEFELRDAIEWGALANNIPVLTLKTTKGYEDISIAKDGLSVIGWSDKPESGKYWLIGSTLEGLRLVEHKGVAGLVIEERGEPLELVTSEIDTHLKRLGVRDRYDIIVTAGTLRDAGDIMKLVGLGADIVLLPAEVMEIAVGEGSRKGMEEKALNLMAGLKREIALIAGAAGVYKVSNSMVGNRELMRNINLSSEVSRRLRVKVAGSL
ncbi:glutamate synthase [Sulfodiicoccus acidiphilus]|uniref:Archaeal glutamate synthase [NADPH] n=1 Tax=Sulfodiicoccus acidiphilus TaxID=1670455 RepID=A0A348B0X5_9CREN|nr:glutamate synthase-related protein [Sulfodiicoccus acidiphilus]BBD71827.1 glutamate synthase [Sulfodiicoccus acidiphilus]GGT99432.1 glutamate synthase [Sulfodiicoccus acidiphilus]